MNIDSEMLTIIITIFIFILAQTGSLIWFLSKLSSNLSNLSNTVNELKQTLNSFVTIGHLSEKLKRVWGAIEENKKDIAIIQDDLKKHIMRTK